VKANITVTPIEIVKTSQYRRRPWRNSEIRGLGIRKTRGEPPTRGRCDGLEWGIGCDPLFLIGSGTPEPVSSRHHGNYPAGWPAFRIQEKHASTILEHLLEQGEFVRDKTCAKFSVASILRFSRAAEKA
jgi:hypothetical protein